VKATTDGVVRPPSSLAMTLGSPPSMTATTEFVVPRSMPIVLPTLVTSRGWPAEIGTRCCRPPLPRLTVFSTQNNSSVERMKIRRQRLLEDSLQAREIDKTKVLSKNSFRGYPNSTILESQIA